MSSLNVLSLLCCFVNKAAVSAVSAIHGSGVGRESVCEDSVAYFDRSVFSRFHIAENDSLLQRNRP